jgi:hypothetical protein
MTLSIAPLVSLIVGIYEEDLQ